MKVEGGEGQRDDEEGKEKAKEEQEHTHTHTHTHTGTHRHTQAHTHTVGVVCLRRAQVFFCLCGVRGRVVYVCCVRVPRGCASLGVCGARGQRHTVRQRTTQGVGGREGGREGEGQRGRGAERQRGRGAEGQRGREGVYACGACLWVVRSEAETQSQAKNNQLAWTSS